MIEPGERHRPLSELEIVQNPVLGAFALWHFGLGHQSEAGSPAPFPLAFLVLPLILHRKTLDFVTSARSASGLLLFAAKLAEEREALLAVHERATLLRPLTLQSVAFGVNAGLLSLNYEQATLRANTPEKTKKPVIPQRIRGVSGAAEKLGRWFSRVSLVQVVTALQVEF
jgi:hypothetical protein